MTGILKTVVLDQDKASGWTGGYIQTDGGAELSFDAREFRGGELTEAARGRRVTFTQLAGKATAVSLAD